VVKGLTTTMSSAWFQADTKSCQDTSHHFKAILLYLLLSFPSVAEVMVCRGAIVTVCSSSVSKLSYVGVPSSILRCALISLHSQHTFTLSTRNIAGYPRVVYTILFKHTVLSQRAIVMTQRVQIAWPSLGSALRTPWLGLGRPLLSSYAQMGWESSPLV